MNWGFVIELSKFITALVAIVGVFNKVVSKTFDIKLKSIMNRDRMQLRFQIVSFASDLRRNVPHTRYEYLSVFELIDEYNIICKELGIPNHAFESEVEYIDKKFQSLDILNIKKES